jgi:hypothetical protein
MKYLPATPGFRVRVSKSGLNGVIGIAMGRGA